MSKACPYCHSRNTTIDFPGELDIFEKYSEEIAQHMEIPYKCLVCGYLWKSSKKPTTSTPTPHSET